jgi:uncharacterized LabA/DUF88 family protein
MRHPEKEIFKRLGNDGLSRVLGDLIDRTPLVRLANSCGLKYPGMRTQSQNSERILSDLVKKAGHEEAARKAIYRALQKETRSAARKWNGLSAEEKLGLLDDDRLIAPNGQLAIHLFLTASSDAAEDDRVLQKLLALSKKLASDGAKAPPATKKVRPSREQTRLRKRVAELQKKAQHLEGQVAKSRESEKVVKRELILRKKELGEARLQAERLQRELASAHEETRKASSKKKTPEVVPENIEQLGKAVRRLASGQKKLTHTIEKLSESAPAESALAPEIIAPVSAAIQSMQKELAALRRDSKKELRAQDKRLDTMLGQMATLTGRRGAGMAGSSSHKRGPDRVGVFVDVQNMYYGARQLKGKLDFDALLEAAVLDRRLIQATAYVVESKEIDQSGFIAILQQRAIEVRRKTLRVRADGSMKGDWDMELALDILDAASGLDVVVLVSGDGDFTSLVKRVKQMGPRVEVIGFPRNTAKSLLEAADNFQPLNRKFMIYPDRAKSTSPKSKKIARV